MVETIVEAPVKTSFVDEVCSIPGGEAVHSCIQCGVCTGSCPTADKWDYPPRRVIAMVRAGLREELLSSNSMWFCVSCYSCTVRCPRNIKPTSIMHALQILALRDNLNTKRSLTPDLYKSFVDSIKDSGRIHELGMMIKLYLKRNLFVGLKMMPVGLSLFFQGRLPLRPGGVKARKQFKAILDKAEALGGAK